MEEGTSLVHNLNACVVMYYWHDLILCCRFPPAMLMLTQPCGCWFCGWCFLNEGDGIVDDGVPLDLCVWYADVVNFDPCPGLVESEWKFLNQWDGWWGVNCDKPVRYAGCVKQLRGELTGRSCMEHVRGFDAMDEWIRGPRTACWKLSTFCVCWFVRGRNEVQNNGRLDKL